MTKKEYDRIYHLKHKERDREARKNYREKNKAKLAASNKKWKEKNKEKVLAGYRRYQASQKVKDRRRSEHLRKTYGITLIEYMAMVEAQQGLCASCGGPPNPIRKKGLYLAVDHNHETKEIRALLCGHCNLMIGHALEDISRLEKGILYLKRFTVVCV